jgi:hypothetical protein
MTDIILPAIGSVRQAPRAPIAVPIVFDPAFQTRVAIP